VRFLGSGAFGETWLVEAETANRRSAVKILAANYPPERLAREVEGLTRVDNKYVVKLLAHDVVDLGATARPALTFEYIDGGDVEQALAKDLPTAAELGAFARGLLSGIWALHETDTVHRDIKPANIALRSGRWDRPVLLDLGLAKMLDSATVTAYPSLLGTPAFMAPEQVRAERARKQADIWAAGTVLYVLATGRHPFVPGRHAPLTREGALEAFGSGPAPLPATIPQGLANLLLQMLSVSSSARGSATRVRRQIEEIFPKEPS
jgi:serine/threonine-protein kinase